MTQQQEVIDQLIDYIDKAILKNSVSNRHVAAVLAFLNEGLKDKTIDIEELKKYFLSKTGPDETKHLLKLLGGLEVKNGIQTDTITATEDVSGKNIKAGDTVSGTNVTATDKITSKDIDITNVAMILRAIFKGDISSETFVSGLLGTGWNATSEGDIEARSLLLRAFLEVPELRYNKITVIGSEFWVSEGGIIQEVAEAGENQYVVTLKLEEGDTNPFDIDDILRGIYHHNAGFRMVMFRVISVYENSTMLVMPQLTDVLPCKFMNIARMGNFTKTERQRSIYLSGKDGYIRFLDGVNSWEIAPAMVAMQLGNTKGFVHPVFGDMSGYSALLENIFMTGSIRVISADGVTAKPVPVDKGAYNAGERYYEYDRVTYGGSLYLCIAKETTETPSATSVDWLKEVSKGDTGAKGATGPQGPAGAKGATGATGPTGSQGIPGTSQYFHVKYSANSNGNPMVDTPNTYIGTAVSSSATAPTSYSSYKWVKMEGSQGPQGTQGIAGPKGTDGRTTYLHIKYSNDGKAFTANAGETPGAYIGQYTDFSEADSNTFSDYTWTKVKGETGAQGPAGAKGATGATGPTGSQGIPGTSQYFHVKYSASASGNPMVDTPNTYIGTAVTASATAPTAYTSYKWVQLKGSQGPQGTQGIAGTKGADGRTPYLHIKYSDDGKAFTANAGETPGAYIGQYTDFTVTDSTIFSAYTWSKIKGETGAKGPTGATGPAGAKGATGATGPTGSQGIPGTSQYFHIRYSAASTGNPMVTTPNTYIGTAVTSSATAPTAYTSYKWSQFKGSQGAQGTQGIAGTKGADGRTPYLHIKYSDNGTSFTANSGETPGAYIGQYTDFTATDSNTFSAYTWSKIKGETGAKGPTGATGPAGAKGAVGQVGPVGPIGPKGDAGAKGATGATGATGPTGPTGPKGATGAKGDKGDAIASSYMNGVMKYADPYFRTSANSTGLYNNSGGTAGIWERLAKPAGVPGPSSYYMRYRYTVGTTSPNRGGFTFSTTTYRNCEYIARIIAKIPVGYTINYHANSQGNNPIAGWLTPNTGTGSYTEYVFRLKCSDSGTFSTSMFFSFNGANAAFTVEVAYATVFDTVANDRTTYIDSNGVYTGTLIARQITATNVVFGTANIGDATITNAKISAVDAAKISTGYLSAARIAALAITSDKIATNAITAAKIAAGTITSDKINITSIRAAILTADAIAALTITTGKLNVTNGATIGGWKVEGNSLSIKSAASAKILVEPTGGRFLRINDNSSELLSIRADGATGINIYTQSTTGKCLIMHAQTGGMAVESYGNHIFYQRPGETWNAPGTLWAARISAGGSIENYWGNGCTASATRIGIGQYRINHDLGHLSYFVMITCTPYSTTGNKWVFGMIVEKQDRSLIVHILDTNKGNLDAAFEIAIIGRNRI